MYKVAIWTLAMLSIVGTLIGFVLGKIVTGCVLALCVVFVIGMVRLNSGLFSKEGR